MSDLPPQVYSGSSISTFLRCAKQWEYAYVYAIKKPPRLRMVIGNAAHAAVEVNFTQKITSRTDMPLSDVEDAFSDEFDRLVVEAEPDPDEPARAGKDSGVLVVRSYQENVAKDIQPLMVEKEVQFDINGVAYSGYVDLVDDQRTIRDLKTTGRRPYDQGRKYALAMTGYALGYRALTGDTESDVVLDYMVRTLKPYHLPVRAGGPVSEKSVNNFASIVAQVDAAVRSGNFLPTGLTNGACSWCGYKDICPAYRDA